MPEDRAQGLETHDGEVLEQVRILRERISEFVQLPNDRATRNLRRQSKLNSQFANEAFGAVGATGRAA